MTKRTVRSHKKEDEIQANIIGTFILVGAIMLVCTIVWACHMAKAVA